MSHPAEQLNQTNWIIASGEYDEAIVSLTCILKTLKLFLSGDCHSKIALPVGVDRDHGEEIDQSEKCASSSSSLSVAFDYDFFSLPNTSSFLRFSDTTSTDDNSWPSVSQPPFQVIVYRGPIMALSRKALDMQVCRELTYVTLYNLALSYHLKSFELRSSSDLQRAHLRKALSLYELSQMLQVERSITIRVNAVHSMALVSNLRHIHFALGHIDKVDMCSEHLLSTMMYILHCGDANTLGNSIEGFLDVILPLISKSTSASAA